ncbi:MAG: acyl-CoA dehydrogenase family protein [Pseudomonadota bacterium]
MNILFTDEQRLLAESLEQYAAGRYSFDQRRAVLASDEGYSPEAWHDFAELGWLGLAVPEEDGGLGGSLADVAVLMEGFGRMLALEPFVATVLLGAGLLAEIGTPEQRAAYLPGVAEGTSKLAFGHSERQARFDLADVRAEARSGADGFVLDGHKCVVLGAPAANHLLVSARTDGGPRDDDGVSLFIVPADAEGLTMRGYPMQDGHRAADVTLENVAVGTSALVGPAGEALPAIRRVVQRAMIALAAEAVGAMEALNAMTFEYLRTRQQFGAPIGSFQGLQHRAVEMEMAHKISRAMVHRMARAADANSELLGQCAAAVKAEVGKSGKFVGQQAIQLHGGIGMTDEYAASHYFKRLTMIDILFGNADHHLAEYARLSQETAASSG